ncbi:MAG: DNA internalization-related competence protein ComEC/Rec2 [Candidatus Polarisedimenticolaceae bacterium]|nr:DNA internalization-related competence protein ComEC/Rec2 [Candidatus Polarisedimenticolaceae bacterium]
MVIFAVAFVTGVSLFQFSPVLPAPGWLLCTLPLAFFWLRTPKLYTLWAFIAGLLWAFLQATLALSSQLTPDLERQNVLVSGCITSLPEQIGRRVRFQFDVEEMQHDGRRVAGPDRIRLSWYSANSRRLQAGDCWQLMVRLKRPHGSYNSGGMDYEGWLYRSGIRASGYIRKWDGNRQLERGHFKSLIHRLRQQIGEHVDQMAGESQRGVALFKALTIGDRSGLTTEQWQTYSKTGTNHLVAISGLHIGIVAGWLFFIGRFIWSRCSWLTLRVPATTAAAVIALLAASIYAALAGFSLPTQRALIMLTIALLAKMMQRSIRPSQILATALFVVVLIDPASTLSPGLWLSFIAVGVILFAMGNRLNMSGWQQWGRVQWVVAIGLIPLLLLFFAQLSLVSPLVNLAAVPLFTLLLVPLALLVLILMPLPTLSVPLLHGVTQLLAWSEEGLSYVAALPIASWQSSYLPLWVWPLILMAILLLLLPRGLPGRWLGLVLLLPPLMMKPESPPLGGFYFTLLDVGQGLSAIVETKNHTLVYDAGARFSDRFNVGSAIVLPYLQYRGINKVDQLVISNGDADHAGGGPALYKGIEVTKVMSGEPERLPLLPSVYCEAGMQWQWDGVTFSVLHPDHNSALSGNDLSCVIHITNGAASLLLTGDIEAVAERQLLANNRTKLSADIVQVPHHGSKTSSTAPFVDAVSARYAVVSAGYKNRFSFPKEEVRQRWLTSGATFYNTASSGALRFEVTLSGDIIGPVEERVIQRSYWNDDIKSGGN